MNWELEKDVKLEKFPGKGGWTYASLAEVKPNSEAPFGWQEVDVQIDNEMLYHVKLMPLGNGTLFLPVSKALQKKLKKEAGQYVSIKLVRVQADNQIPQELIECLQIFGDRILAKFNSLTPTEQSNAAKWIYQTKNRTEQEERINQLIDQLSYHV